MLDLSNARQPPPLVPSTVVRLLPSASRFVLRGGSQVMATAGAALGLNISDIACRSARQDTSFTPGSSGARAALWMGPDEQLLLAAVSEGAPVARLLNEALAALPHSLVDVSHRQI